MTIGDVTKEVKPARNPQFVPCKYCKYSRANWWSLFLSDANYDVYRGIKEVLSVWP